MEEYSFLEQYGLADDDGMMESQAWSTGDDPGMGDEMEAAYEEFLRTQSQPTFHINQDLCITTMTSYVKDNYVAVSSNFYKIVLLQNLLFGKNIKQFWKGLNRD